MAFKVIEYRQLIQILAIFMLVQFFGLLLATVEFNGAPATQVVSDVTFNNTTSIIFLIGYIA